MMRTIFRWAGLLFWATVIAGCAQSEKSATSLSTATPTIFASNIPAAETIPLTSTLLATDTPTPINTSTALPTLSAEAAINRLLDLLVNNGGCHLPCLWGITPGKSTFQEAQAILAPLSVIRNDYSVAAKFKPGSGFVDLNYTEGDLMFSVKTAYLADNQIVNRLRLYAREYQLGKIPNSKWGLFSVLDSETFGKRVGYYSLSHVLSEQGIPDAAMISTLGEPIYEGGEGFRIVLLYPEKGIWVKYTTQQYYFSDTGTIKGCPANAHIEMELFPSGNADSFFTSLKQNQDWVAQQKNWFQPLEKTTNMTLAQFYETFRQPTDKCIETPANLWPIPEP